MFVRFVAWVCVLVLSVLFVEGLRRSSTSENTARQDASGASCDAAQSASEHHAPESLGVQELEDEDDDIEHCEHVSTRAPRGVRGSLEIQTRARRGAFRIDIRPPIEA